MRRASATLLLAILFAVQPASAAPERVLRLLSPGSPETLDPHLRHFAGERVMDSMLLEGLTREDADGNPVPAAAVAWDIGADGRRYTFHLRPGATFSDGHPVTAESFVYAFRRLVDPKTASEATAFIEPVLHARDCIAGTLPPEALGAEATDPMTLAITLEQPNPFFLTWAGQLVPLERDVVERWGRDWTLPEHMVSNGPFTLAEFVLHGNVGFLKNPLYWNASAIRLDRVSFVSVDNSRTAQRMFAAGEVDAVSLTSEEFKDGGPLLGAQLRLQPVNRTGYFFFNLRGGPLAESQGLRRALALTLDQDILQTRILKSVDEPAYAMVPSLFPNYAHPREDFADRPMPDRLAEARRLIAQAGYGPDHPLVLKLVTSDRKTCPALQEMWRIALGVRVACDIIQDDHGLYQAYRTGEFDLGLDFENSLAPDPLDVLGNLRAEPMSPINFGQYRSEPFNALLRQAEASGDAAVRADKLAQAERILLDDQAIIPFAFTRTAYAVSPRVHGYRALPSRTLFIDGVTVDP